MPCRWPTRHGSITAKSTAPRQLTDVYLLGLAVSHGEGLVTLDRNIPLAAVVGAQKTQLLVL